MADCHEAEQAGVAVERPFGGGIPLVGIPQGVCSFQGGTPVPGDQMPVWLYQDAVSGAVQKYGQSHHAIHAVERVDGEAEINGDGINPPESWKIG